MVHFPHHFCSSFGSGIGVEFFGVTITDFASHRVDHSRQVTNGRSAWDQQYISGDGSLLESHPFISRSDLATAVSAGRFSHLQRFPVQTASPSPTDTPFGSRDSLRFPSWTITLGVPFPRTIETSAIFGVQDGVHKPASFCILPSLIGQPVDARSLVDHISRVNRQLWLLPPPSGGRNCCVFLFSL